MSTEDLLKPRYKVIADYPNSPQSNQIGFIYDRNDKEWTEMWWNQMSHFPHLFKRLEWWEERKPEEMPEYIQCTVECRIQKGTILKANWESYTTSNEIAHRGKNPDFWIDAKYFIPATETEYNEYLKQIDNGK